MDLKNFENSTLNLTLENTNKDTYLKVFDPFISNSKAKPDNFNSLTNKLSITLDHLDYYLDAGIISHEDLQIIKKVTGINLIFPITTSILQSIKIYMMDHYIFHQVEKYFKQHKSN